MVLATQRRNEDDGRTLMNCVGALHCHGYPVAWDALYPRPGARLRKLPLYPWQSKRYWNETQEAAEDLHYHPVHPLLGQPVSGIHPTWEVELSTVTTPFLADHQVQGSILVPGAVYIEMALAAAQATYGSTDYSVDNLELLRAQSSTRPATPSYGPPSTATGEPWNSPRSRRQPAVTSSGP